MAEETARVVRSDAVDRVTLTHPAVWAGMPGVCCARRAAVITYETRPVTVVDMVSAALVWLAGAVWRVVRALLLLVACLLGADLVAVILFGPTALLGPAAGIAVTVVLSTVVVYVARRIVVARRTLAERELAAVRAAQARRRTARRWALKLRELQAEQAWRVDGYRAAVREVGLYGEFAGLALGCIGFAVTIEFWPVWLAFTIDGLLVVLGFAGVVAHEVHLARRVRDWRCRRLTRRLAAFGGLAGGHGSAAVDAFIGDLLSVGGDGAGGGDDGGGDGGGSDSEGDAGD